jgi:hypothetical protein
LCNYFRNLSHALIVSARPDSAISVTVTCRKAAFPAIRERPLAWVEFDWFARRYFVVGAGGVGGVGLAWLAAVSTMIRALLYRQTYRQSIADCQSRTCPDRLTLAYCAACRFHGMRFATAPSLLPRMSLGYHNER